jgi:hypothetical protein
MLFHHLLNVDVPRLQAWAPPVVGLLTFAGLFVCAHGFLRRWHAISVSRNPPVPSLPADPFKACLTERRAAVRRQGNPVEVLLTGLEDGGPKRGWVLDRSLEGLRIWLPDSMPSGRLLAVHRLDAPARSPWIPLQVKHCRSSRSTCTLGGAFVEAPALAGLLFA